MAGFTETFLSGVALAFVGFMGKEIITSQKERHKIRKILITDANDTVAGLDVHLPSLSVIRKNLDEGGANFIWEGEGAGSEPSFLNDVPTRLSPRETSLVLSFYDSKGRLDAIRTEYNLAIRNSVVDQGNREQHIKITKACLSDMERNYKEICDVGKAMAAELQKRLWSEDYQYD